MSISKTQKIFLESFDKSNLLKVRLKIDPAKTKLKEFSKLNGYEGYILNEDLMDRTFDVLMLGDFDDPIIRNIPMDCIDNDSIVSKLDKFKIAAKAYLIYRAKANQEEDAEVFTDVELAKSINDIEKKLKDFGLNNEQVCEVYKLYVLINEPI